MKKLFPSIVVLLTANLLLAQNIDFSSNPILGNYLLNNQVKDLNGNDIFVDSNGDGLISYVEADNISEIPIRNIPITTLPGIQHFNNLEKLLLDNVQIVHFSFGLPNVIELEIVNCSNLQTVQIYDTSIEVVDFRNCPILTDVRMMRNNIQSLDLSGISSLVTLWVGWNPLDDLTIGYQPNLLEFIASYTNFTTLDMSPADNGGGWYLLDNIPTLNYLNVKNGGGDNLFLPAVLNSTLYICSDDEDSQNIEREINNSNQSIVYNSYCSFIPGGSFNEISGSSRIDFNTNGCDPMDLGMSFLKFAANDGTNSGFVVSDENGYYYAPVDDGQHTLTPMPEIPSYWTFSPASFTVDFPTQVSPINQDFCVTPNGSVEDLEVVILPVFGARPGFDTEYLVKVKNKGNQIASGTVTLDFEKDFMTLLSSNPTASQPNTNQLSWSFSNLNPFEMLEYEFTMTLNPPTDPNFPLNSNDILTYTANVTGTGTDAMPSDNTMVLDQLVVNSYDPNDKTCLEGETILPSEVGEYVHYMIRFENTGTASAINVVIKDVIDETKFDVSSLIPLGGSHDYVTRIREGNIVEFIHENINLDFNDATNDGHVLFKIKTLGTLADGDTFDNQAEIYFDFNFPIITNNEVTAVDAAASNVNIEPADFTLYPNPSQGRFTVNSKQAFTSLKITDLSGRLVAMYSFTDAINKREISTDQFNSGVYLVTLEGENTMGSQRLVIE